MPDDFRKAVLARIIVGDPDTVGEQVQTLLDAGLDGMIFNFADSPHPDTIRLAGSVLGPVMGIPAG